MFIFAKPLLAAALLGLWAIAPNGCDLSQKTGEVTMSENIEKTQTEYETATFAAGCFWSVQETYRKTPGVISTAAGYIGGSIAEPSYKQVCTGRTGHAEAVQIVYDPDKVTYEKLLSIFFSSHDPTTLNRQGPDVGTQYRSAIFYHNEDQQKIAAAAKQKLSENKNIVTQIAPAPAFYPAEQYHQFYLQKKGVDSCQIGPK
jgi:peptide-methionine (S)-S-oxide reductase